MQWNMNPFAVAQKTHLINGVLGYEAQLVAAVINNSGVVKDRFHFEWFGDWTKIVGKFKEVESRTKTDDNGNPKKYIVPDWKQEEERGLGVRVWATLRGEKEPRELELLLTQARTRNSTLWTEDPKQQIAYLAQKRWARLYAPDVILGVYTGDELDEPSEKFMGMVDEVGTRPSKRDEKKEVPVWPDDALEQRLPKYRRYLAAGKTHDEIIAFAEQKGRLTDAQKERLRALKPDSPASAAAVTDTDTAPKFDYAAVANKLRAAKNLDQLADAASVISAVADAQQRGELTSLYDQRAAELSATSGD
jgi:hypothetical protein